MLIITHWRTWGIYHHPDSKSNLWKDFVAVQAQTESWQRFPVKWGNNFCKLKWRAAQKNLCLVSLFFPGVFPTLTVWNLSIPVLWAQWTQPVWPVQVLAQCFPLPKWLLSTFSPSTCVKWRLLHPARVLLWNKNSFFPLRESREILFARVGDSLSCTLYQTVPNAGNCPAGWAAPVPLE